MPAKPKKQQNTTVSKKGRKASSRSTTVKAKAKSAAPKRTTKTVDAPPDWATATRYTYRSHVD